MVSVLSRCARGLIVIAVTTLPFTASAQQAPDGSLEGLLETVHLKAKLAPAAGFVTTSRPAKGGDFIPVGTPHPDRAVKVMSPAEVLAAEADLDASRERQQRRAGRRPPSVPLKPTKGAAKGTVP